MNTDIHRHTPTLNAIDSRGLTTRLVAYHRRQRDEALQVRVTRQIHNASGQMTAAWDARFSPESPAPNQSYAYSLTGLMLSSDNVDAGARLLRHADAGNVTEVWDTRGGHWQTDYDPLLRPAAIHENNRGQPGQTSRSTTQRFSYAATSPEAALRNQCGRLIRHDDNAGSLFTLEYGLTETSLSDTRHFLRALEAPDWPANEYQRDLLLEPGDGASTRWVRSPTGEMLAQFDAAGHRQTMRYTLAGELADVQMRSRAGDEQTVVQAMVYDAFGHLEQQTAGNGIISRDAYDSADGRLLRRTAVRPDRSVVQDLSYGYDPVGNIIQVQDHTQSTRYFNNQRVEGINTYAYDSLDQLIQASGREVAGARIQPGLPDLAGNPGDTSQLLNYTQHYHYDSGGNLTQLRHIGHQNYTRDMQIAPDSNRSVPIVHGRRMMDFAESFDANGNLLMLETGQQLQWDSRNQLRNVVMLHRDDANDDTEQYVYDGGGQRLRKVRNTHSKTTTRTHEVRYLPGLEVRTDQSERLEVMTLQAGLCSVRYLHWTEGKPAGIDNDQLRYGLSDHLNSTALEVDAQGQLLSHEGYYPYGGTAWWAAKSAVHATYKTIRYSGKERDASGLYYYGFRYYAPWLQRWINPDPAGDADGLNLYKMVGNSPVTMVDPDGLMFSRAAAQVAVGGGVIAYQMHKAKNRPQPGTDAPAPETPGNASASLTQADKWLEKTRSQVMQPQEKVVKAFTGRQDAINDLSQGKVPGLKAMVKGLETVKELSEFAAHGDYSGLDKTRLMKSAGTDFVKHSESKLKAAVKTAKASVTYATLPEETNTALHDEVKRIDSETKDGLYTSLGVGAAVNGSLGVAANMVPFLPAKILIHSVGAVWKVAGVTHTAAELGKISEKRNSQASHELSKDFMGQVKASNQKNRGELLEKIAKKAA